MIYSDLFFQELEKENSEEQMRERIKNYTDNVLPFYHDVGEPLTIMGQNNIPLSCLFFKHMNPKAKVLIVTGYNESYLKYAEFIQDLYNLNISVYCYDHRGQGFSGRFLNQKNRGFIDKFSFLVDDLCLVYNHVLKDNEKIPLYIIAHSMGGAVAAQALCEQKIKPAYTILAAPMFEVMLTPWKLFEIPIYTLSKLACSLGFSKYYVFGQKNCIPYLPFETNDVTHSKFRFLTWRKHLAEIPVLQLGGPTFGWIYESIKASRRIRKSGLKNLIPTIILQAEEDIVIRNSAHDAFISSCPKARKVVFGHARHEIFMEIDFVREKAFDIIKSVIK